MFKQSSQLILINNHLKNCQTPKITQTHFNLALAKFKPTYGLDQRWVEEQETQFIIYNEFIKKCLTEVAVNKSPYLICGVEGSGKISLAKKCAALTKSSTVKIINADHFLTSTITKQLELLEEEFSATKLTGNVSIILQDVENILQYDPLIRMHNNLLRLKLISLIKQYKNDAQFYLFITTSDELLLQKLNLTPHFNTIIQLPTVVITKNVVSMLAQHCQLNIIGDANNDEELRLPIGRLLTLIKAQQKKGKIVWPHFVEEVKQIERIEKKSESPLSFLRHTSSPLHNKPIAVEKEVINHPLMRDAFK